MPALNIGPRFVSAGQLEEEESQRIAEQQHQQRPVVSDLASYVQRCWSAAQRAKTPVTKAMLRAQRMLNGEYEPDKLRKIKQQGGSSIYMRLADEKATAAKAWITDTLLPPDEEPWAVESTPVPSLPDDYKGILRNMAMKELEQDVAMGVEVSQADVQARVDEIESRVTEEMRKICKEAEAVIQDKMRDAIVESNWRTALKNCVSDMVDYKAGFIKGPLFRHGRKLVWENGRMVPKKVVRIEFDSPSPFNIFPSPSSCGVNDGYIIEKHSLRRTALVAMRGVEGYDTQAIDDVLREYGQGGLRQWLYTVQGESEHNTLAGRSTAIEDPEGTIDALQFKGSVQGLWLLEHGVSIEELGGEVMGEYETEVWIIGGHVIKCVLNEDPLGSRNYWKVSFRPRKDQFWGDGICDLISDVVDMCNASARNLVNNIGIATGPQIGVDTDAMPPGEKITGITPMKIWQFSMKDVQSSTRAPIWFFQPRALVNELTKTYEFFSREADNKTGIPKYVYGQGGDGSGAADTATGFSMMMNNASRNIKQVIKNIDEVIKGSIDAMLLYLKLTDGDDPIWHKADVNIRARGTTSLLAREQSQVRRNEFLGLVSQSERLSALIGDDGLAAILRPMAKGLDLDAADIVPSAEEMKRVFQYQQQLQQTPAGPQQQGQGPPGRSPQPPRPPAVNQAGQVQGGRDARIV
ncbi:MAG: hypothetical protein SVM79_00040 [Chloroflexota bacterium]|nr:hypothetical protein [Chloroflexota bacterium]